jgi:hypothetical protein
MYDVYCLHVRSPVFFPVKFRGKDFQYFYTLPCLLERRFLLAAAALGSTGTFLAAGLLTRSRSMSRLSGDTCI